MENLKEKLDALEQAAQAMAQTMYADQGNGGVHAEPFEANDDDTVVDAEFEEKE